jgi:HlyD family type I secretion membrane fusion protein
MTSHYPVDLSVDLPLFDASAPETLDAARTEEFLPPIGQWLTYGSLAIVLAVGAAIPISGLVKYKITVRAESTVRPAGELRLLQAATEGQIQTIFAKEGQRVKAGDKIATVDDSRLQTRRAQLESSLQQLQMQVVQIDAQATTLNAQIVAEEGRNRQAVTVAQSTLEQSRREHEDKQVATETERMEIEYELATAQTTLAAAKVKRDRYRGIVQQGAVSMIQYEETQLSVEQQEQAVLTAQAKLQRAQAMMNPSGAAVEAVAEQVAQAEYGGEAATAALVREQEALLQQKTELNKQAKQDEHELAQITHDLKQTTLRAAIAGTLSQMRLRNVGQTVQSGEVVAYVVPSDTPLEVKASVATKDISKLELDQHVKMRVSACPYPDYGTLSGVVSQISKDTTKPGSSSTEASAQAAVAMPAVYEVTVKPDSDVFGRGSKQCTLQMGMDGRTDIITKEETVLQFFLRKTKLIADV